MSVPVAAYKLDAFFNAADADLALLSSDGVLFHTHKCILRTAAPFFADLLSLPQPPSPSPSPSPAARAPPDVIAMSEPAPALRLLLSFAHPRTALPEPALETQDDLRAALALARKFDVPLVRAAAARALQRLAQTDPEAAYALAWAHELRGAARGAARASLRCAGLPFMSHGEGAGSEGQEDAAALAGLPALALVRLYRYHAAAAAALSTLGDPVYAIGWMPQAETFLHSGAPGAACTHDLSPLVFAYAGEAETRVWAKSWWWAFVRAAAGAERGALVDRRSVEKAVRRGVGRAVRDAAAKCEFCAGADVEGVLECTVERLVDEIERRLEEIPLDTPF